MVTQFKSKNALVYDQLRQNIIHGVYQAGSRLIIDELAAELGVSQIPIREAMRQLEADGFVKIVPHVGVTVAEIDAGSIFEVFGLLESIELLCSRAACEKMTEVQLETLTKMIAEMDATVSKPEQWASQNKALHVFISNIAGTHLALKLVEKVLDHWDRLRSHYLKDVFALRIYQAQEEHKQILQAFADRDLQELEQAIHTHNQTALESYLHHMRLRGHLHIPEENSSLDLSVSE